MSKQLYIGVNGVARAVTGAYVGASSLARRVTAGYVGVGGVARPFYQFLRGPARYGAAEQTESNASGAIAGHYAFFIGPADVIAYDATLTRHDLGRLGTARIHPAVAEFAGNIAICGGFRAVGSSAIMNRAIETYTAALVRASVGNLSGTTMYPAAACAGGNLLVALGQVTSSAASTVVDAFNEAFARSTASALSTAVQAMTGVTVDGCAVFAGGLGESGDPVGDINHYAADLTRTNPATLAAPGAHMGAVWTGSHALFAGGLRAGAPSAAVDGFTPAFARASVPALSSARVFPGAAALGGCALVAGGDGSSAVDYYSASLTHAALDPLLSTGERCYGAAVGPYAIFSGADGSATVYSEA